MVSSIDLRKLIKYEERMGCLRDQNDYFEGLFRRTTASYRAKIDKAKSAASDSPKEISKIANKRNRNRKYKSDENQRPSQSSHESNNSHTTILDDYYEVWKRKQSTNYAYSASDTDKTPTNTQGYRKHEKGNRNQTLSDADLNSYIQDWQTKLVLNDPNNEPTDESSNSYKQPEDIHINNAKSKYNLKFADEYNPEAQENLPSTSSIGYPEHLQEKKNGKGITKSNLESNNKLKEIVHDMVLDEFRKQFQEGLNKNIDQMKCAFVTKYPKPLASSENNSTGIKRLPLAKAHSNRAEWQPLTENYNRNRRLSPQVSSLRSRSPAVSSHSHGVTFSRCQLQNRARKPKKCDPVTLYQYYKKQWQHFRKQIPGETQHPELRRQIHQRMTCYQ